MHHSHHERTTKEIFSIDTGHQNASQEAKMDGGMVSGLMISSAGIINMIALPSWEIFAAAGDLWIPIATGAALAGAIAGSIGIHRSVNRNVTANTPYAGSVLIEEYMNEHGMPGNISNAIEKFNRNFEEMDIGKDRKQVITVPFYEYSIDHLGSRKILSASIGPRKSTVLETRIQSDYSIWRKAVANALAM